MLDKNENPEHQKEHHEQQSSANTDSPKHLGQELHAEGLCRHKKDNGDRCGAKAMRDSVYCFFHDPACSQEREAARVQGGKERSRKAAVLSADTPNAPLTSAAQVTGLLAETINQVRRGEIDPHVSNAVGYLAGILLKAKQQDEVEQRLARLESILRTKWKDPSATFQAIPELGSFEFVNSQADGEA